MFRVSPARLAEPTVVSAWVRMAERDWPGPPAAESRVGPDGWTRPARATGGRITRGSRWLDETGPGHRWPNHAWLRMAGRDRPGTPAIESPVGPDGWTRPARATGGRITRGSRWLDETGPGHRRPNHAWVPMAGRDRPGPPAAESRVGPDGWTRPARATGGRITRGSEWLDETGLGHRWPNHAWLRMAGRDWPGTPSGRGHQVVEC